MQFKTFLMKKITILSLFSFFAFSTLMAQLPEQAEDISPLLIGETMPDLKLTNTAGQPIAFLDVVKAKPTVVIFYRGGWCPYCNQHLMELGQIEGEIIELGYQIVAISPDAVNEIGKTIDEHQLAYSLLSDADGAFAEAVGIAFKAPDRYENRLFKVSDGKNEGFLPVPSVFILNTEGEIQFEYIDPNYKNRMSGELLIAVLKTMKK